MDDKAALKTLREKMKWVDGNHLEAYRTAVAALETLAKIRAELEQYRHSPIANAGYFVTNVAHLLEPKS